jgi:DNA-binding PadR family transcriptional regulator
VTFVSRGFLLKQKAFLKLYLLEIAASPKDYGSVVLDDLRAKFKPYGYSPSHTELYKTYKELYKQGFVKRRSEIKGDPHENIQEVFIYYLTEKGKDELETYRKLMKVELERSIGILQTALEDHYGPVRK